MKKEFFVFLFFALILSACGSSPEIDNVQTSTNNEENQKLENVQISINIDGKDEDWKGLPIVLEESHNEAESTYLDIDYVKAFGQEQAIYVLTHFIDLEKEYKFLAFIFESDSKTQALIFSEETGEAFVGNLQGENFEQTNGAGNFDFALDEFFECKIALEDLGNPKDPILTEIRVVGRKEDGTLFDADIEPISSFAFFETNHDQEDDTQTEQAEIPEQGAQSDNPNDIGRICGGISTQSKVNFQITEAGTKAELVWASEFVPWWVRSSPDGRVLAVTDAGDAIYELKPDGSREITFQCPGVQIETFAAASDGALWFSSRDGGRLYRVDTSGEVSILAYHGNRNLEAGPNGEVFAMEDGLVRITPDGTQKTITDQVSGRKFAVGPNGEIATIKDGRVVLITDSGELIELASGYGPEHWLAFDADGLLYVIQGPNVDIVDLDTGFVQPIPWLVGYDLGESGAFAPDGRLLLYHPNNHVYAADLTNESVDIYHQVNSNSWAMAASPVGNIYIAFGNKQQNGETSIYRVEDAQTLELILTVPYGIERAMAFDQMGFGYIALADQIAGGAVIRFDTTAETFDVYYQSQCHPSELAIHPITGQVWWEECGQYHAINENGDLVQISSVPGEGGTGLVITSDGAFYTIGFSDRPNPNSPMKRYLYRYDPGTTQWEEIADLSQSDPAITMATLTACPNGIIYTVESLDDDHLPVNRSSFNAVRRLESDGSLTLLGFDFSADGAAASCNPANGQILFTSIAGLFSLTPP